MTKAIEVDSTGNVYFAGTTGSGDSIPGATVIGSPGIVNVFTAKLRSDGTLAYLDVIAQFDVTGIAVDGQGDAFIAGTGASPGLPITAGAFDTSRNQYEGYIVKLGPNGELLYASYTGNFVTAIAVTAQGDALVAGPGPVPYLPSPSSVDPNRGYLIKLDPAGSRLKNAMYLPGIVSAMKVDSPGNVYLTGQTSAVDFPITSGAYTSPVRSRPCDSGDRLNPTRFAMDVFVMKLSPGDLRTVYSTAIGAPCASRSGNIQVTSDEAVVLSLQAYNDFPLRAPVAAGPLCFSYTGPPTAMVTRLTTNASALLFSSYLDACTTPIVAVAPDGSTYAGITKDNHSTVLRIPEIPGIIIDKIANAFSGMGPGVPPGSLVAITGSNLSDPPGKNLGLSSSQPLPYELSGTEVLFDGFAVPIVAATPDEVICIAPLNIQERTIIQIVRGAKASNHVVMPVLYAAAGVMTRTYPSLPSPGTAVDGIVRNEDGTLNDAEHPALEGSTVTLFATGVGLGTGLPVSYGSLTANVKGTATNSPSLINAVVEVRLAVPESPFLGVRRVPVAVLEAALWQGQTPTNAAYVYVLHRVPVPVHWPGRR